MTPRELAWFVPRVLIEDVSTLSSVGSGRRPHRRGGGELLEAARRCREAALPWSDRKAQALSWPLRLDLGDTTSPTDRLHAGERGSS